MPKERLSSRVSPPASFSNGADIEAWHASLMVVHVEANEERVGRWDAGCGSFGLNPGGWIGVL
jgi:hypothetical protein